MSICRHAASYFFKAFRTILYKFKKIYIQLKNKATAEERKELMEKL